MTPDLVLALARLRGRRREVVVVTDRYPPHSVGGAEVSLHIVLRALAMGPQLLVVTFGDRTLTARTYHHEGVDVLELPRQAKWPLHQVAHGLQSKLSTVPPFLRQRVSNGLVQLTRGRRSYADARALIVDAANSNDVPRGGVPLDAIEWEDGLMTRQLRFVLQTLRPKLVHADNYRSILVTSHATRDLEVETVGVVRDNRFHCARYDQSVRTSNGICEECDFACAAEDSPSQPARQRALLELTTKTRHEAIRSMSRTVVTSAYLESELTKIVPGRVVRIPNTPDDAELADEWMLGVAERPGTHLLVVGMINENKGQLGMVRGMRALADRIPDVHLHLAGKGPRVEAKLREILARDGTTDRVTFHGHVDRAGLYALYRECQIVVLPTLWPEPFGRVPLEAGIARRPVVSFAVGGLRESIVDGETGYLVEADDYEGLFEAIAKLAESPSTRRSMGEQARTHVLQTFMLNEVTVRLRDLWESLGG